MISRQAKPASAITVILALLATIPLSSRAQDAPSGRFLDIIVVLDQGLAPGGTAANRVQAAQVAQSLGLSAQHAYGAALFGFAASVPEQRLAAIASNPWVAYVNFDGRVYAVEPPWCGDNPNHPACGGEEDDGGGGAEPSQTVPWGVARIGADTNMNTGAGVHVYVIDTGIDMDHPDLMGNIGSSVDCTGSSGGPPWERTYACASGGDDDNGHGTHVGGTVAAIDNDIGVIGVAPDVTLHAVKVLESNGSGSLSAVIAGIDWVADQVGSAPVVANMSLGGSGSKTGSCSSSGFTGSDAFHQAVCDATKAGVVFAVAAGNDDADAAGFVPAAYDDAVITISAADSSDDWPSWSNWGNNAASWTSHNSAPVAIAAPGVDILSTWNDGGTNTISGTSMATPHVAGAAALFLASASAEDPPQSADYSAFTNTRSALLGADEDTSGFSNTSGNPHDEDFVDASGL